MTNKDDLIKAIDAERPAFPQTRYAIGYNNGLTMAISILMKSDVVSPELHKAVMAERDVAIAQLEEHGIQFGSKAPDVVRAVRCVKCRFYDSGSGYCMFWHGVRYPGHYCGEGEKK